jgi:hypothetical protein
VKGGFIAVGVFASLMGVATVVHWGKLNHSHVAFWLWAFLYFTTPFLIFFCFSGQATVPFVLRVQVSRQIQEPSSEFLPSVLGI